MRKAREIEFIGKNGGCDSQNCKIDTTIIGKPTFGQFALLLSINDVIRPIVIAWNANVAAVTAAFETHDEIQEGDVIVTFAAQLPGAGQFPNMTMRVEFVEHLRRQNIDLPLANWGPEEAYESDGLGGGVGVAVICALSQRGHE